LLNMI